ncbi:AAA family ATPase [Thioflexithrix psekupsensis]|uniref:NACHT domain-containing protein n=1 Tax=Thioflexithrix psekupsensis TaxID=1570016 RepID=A0A251X4V2_9GAMM|nr:AAA family ATPase [Thioflexithrix psekupsensis]OUD12128.1 hypothetical protein TPSD3_13450 [Thioflexithrix psekupsensis]
MIDPLSATVWVWEKFGEKIVEKLGDSARNQWEKFQWNKAKEAYRRALKKDYGHIKLLGKSESVPLTGLFTDVYVHSKISAEQRFNLNELQENFQILENRQRYDGFALLQKENTVKRWFILGKPGAGKTTFLKYITLQAVEGKIAKVPMFVTLHEWADFVRKKGLKDFDLMAFLVEQFKICQFPDAEPFIRHLLEEGQALLLLDGVDEVNQADDERRNMMSALQAISREYRKCDLLLTCRVAAADYSLQNFTYLEVADFTQEQVRNFVKKWFSQDEKRGEQFLTDFFQSEHKGLQELGNVPILLTLLCLIYQEKLGFPERRADIYEEAMQVLLEKWDTRDRSIKRDEIYKGLSKRHKIQFFAHFAYNCFEQNQQFFPKAKLAEAIELFLQKLPKVDSQEINGEAVLKEISAQHGIFIERAKDIYSFAHLSFQEYFTAHYIANNQIPCLDQLIPHVTDVRWREVFLLTVSLLDGSDEFFAKLQDYIDSLIADDETLVNLAKWVNNKALESDMSYSLPTKRSFYYYLSLNGISYSIFDLVFAVAHADNIAVFFIIGFDHEISSPLVDNSSFNFATILHSFTTSNIHPEFTFYLVQKFLVYASMPLTQISNDSINIFHESFGKLIEKNTSKNKETLTEELKNLQERIPAIGSTKEEWKSLAESLKELMRTHCNLGHDWNLSKTQIEKLEQYLEAEKLLWNSLKLAAVNDRKKIESQLLRLPVSVQSVTHLEIKQFKSIIATQLELGRINVFIGANGAGKSNVLEALAFLSAAYENRLDTDTLYDKGIRIAKPTLTMSAFATQNPSTKQTMELAITLDSSNQIRQFITADIQTWQKKSIGLIEPEAYLPLRDYLIYNLDIHALRGLRNDSKKQPLGIYGEGLDTLLFNLTPDEKAELEEYYYLIEWLEKIELDDADNYKYDGYKLGRSRSKLYFKDRFMHKENQIFSAENSNEGVLHVFFYLALFISHKTPRFFAIDNIETSLNPHLCRHLIEILSNLAKKHDKQVLITTHNPAILDGLNLTDNDVRLFIVKRDDDTGETKINRLYAKPNADNERKSVKLSELWMKGYIGAIPEGF